MRGNGMSRLAVCIRHVEFAAGNQTVYVVKVRQDNEEWEVRRAYSDFRKLHEDVQKVMRNEHHQLVSDDCSQTFLQQLQALEFPSKRLFGSKNESVIKERALELHTFLIKLLSLAYKYRKAQKHLYDRDHEVESVSQGSVGVFHLMRDFLKPGNSQPVSSQSGAHSTLSVSSISDSSHSVHSVGDELRSRHRHQQTHQPNATSRHPHHHHPQSHDNEKESLSHRSSPQKKKSPRSRNSDESKRPASAAPSGADASNEPHDTKQRAKHKSNFEVISTGARNIRSTSNVEDSRANLPASSTTHFRSAASMDDPKSSHSARSKRAALKRAASHGVSSRSPGPSLRHGTNCASTSTFRARPIRSSSSGETLSSASAAQKTAVIVDQIEERFPVMRVGETTMKPKPRDPGHTADVRGKKTQNKSNPCDSDSKEQRPRVNAQVTAQSISADAQKELERCLTEYNAIMILRYVDRFISKAVAKTSGCYTVSCENKLLIDGERFLEELHETFTDLPSNFDLVFKNELGDWMFPRRLDAYVQMKWDSFHGRSSIGSTDVTGGRNSDSEDDSDSEYEYTESVGGRLLKKQNFTEEEVDVLQEMIANGTAGTEQMLRLRRQMNDTVWRQRQGPTESDSDDDDASGFVLPHH